MGGLTPGPPSSDSDVQGDRELCGPAHLLLEEVLDRLGLSGRNLDEELVVDLQKNAACQCLLAQRTVDVNHGLLDDIGGAALDGGVEGGPLSHLTALPVSLVRSGR